MQYLGSGKQFQDLSEGLSGSFLRPASSALAFCVVLEEFVQDRGIGCFAGSYPLEDSSLIKATVD
jgi:hypothetical protein